MVNKNTKIVSILYRYLILTLTAVISAINFNLFLKPINFVTGGTGGLAIIMEHLFKISASDFILAVYVIMMIVSFFVLGKSSIISVIYISLLYPFFVKITGNISNVIILDYTDILLITVISGILSGISCGLTYQKGFVSTGLGILGPICNKVLKLPISKVNFVVNGIIVLMGGYYFGIDMILYAIIALYINNVITNRIILGVSRYKALFIQSDRLLEIKNQVPQDSVTKAISIKSFGSFSKKEKNMLLIIVPTRLYSRIVDNLRIIDTKAFLVTFDSYELNVSK